MRSARDKRCTEIPEVDAIHRYPYRVIPRITLWENFGRQNIAIEAWGGQKSLYFKTVSSIRTDFAQRIMRPVHIL